MTIFVFFRQKFVISIFLEIIFADESNCHFKNKLKKDTKRSKSDIPFLRNEFLKKKLRFFYDD